MRSFIQKEEEKISHKGKKEKKLFTSKCHQIMREKIKFNFSARLDSDFSGGSKVGSNQS